MISTLEISQQKPQWLSDHPTVKSCLLADNTLYKTQIPYSLLISSLNTNIIQRLDISDDNNKNFRENSVETEKNFNYP